jgi:ATP-dependent protease Clp ATPase subunit
MNDAMKNNTQQEQQLQQPVQAQPIQKQKETSQNIAGTNKQQEIQKTQSQSSTETQGNMDVTKRDIENVVSSWTGIPISKLTEDESAKLLGLEKRIHMRLIDQEEAVVKVSEAVRRGRIGLASGQRPIASFIFLGPSGTGKTELAKTLAEILFGRDDAMVRLDMSEYMEKHEVAKLIGAPPGYVGYEEGGQLTEAVRAKPYSIVLLDEVEKAHPDVFNILLQVLEDGRLTDNKGNTISFKNTIVICTSNIGSGLITEKLSQQDIKAQKTQAQYTKEFVELSAVVNNELRKFFRPELLNRFDDIVIFKPLRREDMVGIAKLGLEKTAKLLKEQGYSVQVTDKALGKIAQEGYDPMYGARPLRRLIQGSIENPVALEIIGKKLISGDTILIDYKKETNTFTFVKANKPAQAAQDGQQDKVVGQENTGQPLPQPEQQTPTTQAQAVNPQQMYYGQQLPQNNQQTIPQALPVTPVANFDPLSVLGGVNQESNQLPQQDNPTVQQAMPSAVPSNTGTFPVDSQQQYPSQPPVTGAYVAGGAQQDTVLNMGRYQQGAANEMQRQQVLRNGELTASGIDVVNENENSF